MFDVRLSVGAATANGDTKVTVGTDLIAWSGKASVGTGVKAGVMGRMQYAYRNTNTPGFSIRKAVEVDLITVPIGTYRLWGTPVKFTAAGGYRQNLETMGMRPSGGVKGSVGPYFFSVDVRGPSLTPSVESE
jgi:hypothetical protein